MQRPTFDMPIFWPCRMRLHHTALGMLMRSPCGRASAALWPLLGRRLGRRGQRVLAARRLGRWHLGALRPLTPRQPRDGGHPLRASRMLAAPPRSRWWRRAPGGRACEQSRWPRGSDACMARAAGMAQGPVQACDASCGAVHGVVQRGAHGGGAARERARGVRSACLPAIEDADGTDSHCSTGTCTCACTCHQRGEAASWWA